MADIKKELKRDSHSVWSRIKRKTGSTILSVMSLINTPMIANATTQIIPNEEDNSPKIENTHIRTYDVGYQIDTISTSNGAGGSFSVDRNAITLYYNEEDPIKDAKRRHVIAHEKKHQIDNQNNPATLNMSLEEYYKIKHHQEIGATTVGLLQSIYDLETATSEDEAQKIIEQTPDFSEYLKSIHNGEHTIFKCSNPEQFDRELNYMANHVRNQWTDKYVETYESSMLNFIEGYFVSHHYKDIQPNPKVYQKEVSRIYTIGGIDFSKYFEKDITCYNEAVKQADELIMQDAKRSKIISLIKNAENYYINDQNSNKQQSLLPPISFEQLGKLHYDQQKREFINELLSIRQQWLNANPEERGNITSSNQDIQNYLQGLQQGTILPQFTGLSNSEITFINSVEYQKNNLTKQAIMHLNTHNNDIESAPNTYQTLRQQIYLIDGIDYSNAIYEPILISLNPQLLEADHLISNNNDNKTIKEAIQRSNKTFYSPNNIELNTNLNPQQQYELIQHKTFMDNLYKTYYKNDADFIQNFEKYAQELGQEINNNEDAKMAWISCISPLCTKKIYDPNITKVKLEKGDQQIFNDELEKIYTLHGTRIKEHASEFINSLLPKDTNIITISMLDQSTELSRFTNKTKDFFHNMFVNEKRQDQRPEFYLPINKGKPIYKEKTDENRVSDEQFINILNIETPFLKNILKSLELKTNMAQKETNLSKFETHLNNRQKTNNNKQIDTSQDINKEHKTIIDISTLNNQER